MALQFNTTLTTMQGTELASAYGRVTSQDNFTGKTVTGILNIYASKAAFEAGAEPFLFPKLGYAEGPYNRETDGTDTLDFAHDVLIAGLASVGISAEKVL